MNLQPNDYDINIKIIIKMNGIKLIEEEKQRPLKETLIEMFNNKSKSEIAFWTPPTSMSIRLAIYLMTKEGTNHMLKIWKENKKIFVIQRKYNLDVFINGKPFYIMIKEPITTDGRHIENVDRIGLIFDTPISVLGVIMIFTRKANRDEAYRYIYS